MSGTGAATTGTIERRSGQDRRVSARRTADERRRRARRKSRADVDLDLRVSRDRRAEQRRGMFDRRGPIGRRLTDRRRETPAAFSRDDAARIRLMLEMDPPVVACPICHRRLPVERPESMAGGRIIEVRCTECNRTAMITATTSHRILVVDSNAIVRDALSMVLQRAGHHVSEATTVAAAIERFQRDTTAVVIVDLDLDGRSGADVIRHIAREWPATRFIAVVGKSRIGMPDAAVSAKRLGRVEILRKPFAPPAILEALDRSLR